MAAGHAALDYVNSHNLIGRAAEMGEYLGQRLRGLLTHPLVGDVRGMGLMWGLEFVQDKKTKETFDPARKIHIKVYETAKKLGLLLLPSGGCDRGHAGDMILLGPPLTITLEQINELISIIDKTLTQVEEEI